jgi:hypothetical protein
MSDEQFEHLLGVVGIEFEDALMARGLQPVNKIMGGTACLADLGPARDDLRMDPCGERLSQAIDGKLGLISKPLQALGTAHQGRLDERREADGGLCKTGEICQNKANKSFVINRISKTNPKTKPMRAHFSGFSSRQHLCK